MYPGWPHLWHVVKGHAIKGGWRTCPRWFRLHTFGRRRSFPYSHPSGPPGSAPASSAASGRWGVVPGFETGGGGRGGARSPGPACE